MKKEHELTREEKISKKKIANWKDPNSTYNSKEYRKKLSEVKKGKKFTEEHKKRIGDAHRGRIAYWAIGKTPWNKGKKGLFKHTEEAKKRISLSRLNEKNSQWKGNKVKYTALHAWVRRRKPQPKLCTKCNKRKAYDLSNISGEYKRDVNDYEWLCRKCHMEEDGRLYNLNHNKEKRT